MLLKNCQNIEKVIAFATVRQLIRPVLEVASEHADTLKQTKINRGLKEGQQILDIEVERQSDDVVMTGFEHLSYQSKGYEGGVFLDDELHELEEMGFDIGEFIRMGREFVFGDEVSDDQMHGLGQVLFSEELQGLGGG